MKISKNTIRQYPTPSGTMQSLGSNKDLQQQTISHNRDSFGQFCKSDNRLNRLNQHHPVQSARHGKARTNFVNDSMIQDMELELQNVKLENEQYKEKMVDLEKWLVLLLNNFYDGNPNSLKNIEQGLMRIDELRQDNFRIKKALLQDKKKYIDLQNQYVELKKSVQQKEEEMRQQSETNDLILQKYSLEQTLKSLSEEVEILSQKNESLLKDLMKKEFYKDYYKMQNEYEKLQQSHCALISTIQIFSDKKNSKTESGLLRTAFSFGQEPTQKSSFICGAGSPSFSPLRENQQGILGGKSMNQSFLSFISCNGCSPSGLQSQNFGKMGSNNRLGTINPQREEFEAILGKQDINFLSSFQQREQRNYQSNQDYLSNDRSYQSNNRNIEMPSELTHQRSKSRI